MRLPNCEQAIIDLRKLEDYCLSQAHRRGRDKATVFRHALGINQTDSRWLRQSLLEAVRGSDAIDLGSDQFGRLWRIDVGVTRHDKAAVIRTLWIVRTGEDAPRLVTCWVL
jgi:hypothetical protein